MPEKPPLTEEEQKRAERLARRRGCAQRLALLSLNLLALGLVGWGLWRYSPPAAPLAVGALLWLDLHLPSLRRPKP